MPPFMGRTHACDGARKSFTSASFNAVDKSVVESIADVATGCWDHRPLLLETYVRLPSESCVTHYDHSVHFITAVLFLSMT